FEFRLPDIGEGVTEGEIVSWLVQEGDKVDENQDMVEVMTDKATVTIGAPKTGKVSQRRFQVGDTVPVGEVLVVLDLNGGGAAVEAPSAPAPSTSAVHAAKQQEAPSGPGKAPSAGPVASAVGDIREDLPGMTPARAPAPAANGDYFADKPLAAPATRKLARELGVDLRKVEPSGSAGRVTREDVERAAQGPAKAPAPAAAAAPAPAPAAPPSPVAGDERVPIRGLRKRIFENMARSKHTAAHFHYVDEVDVTELVKLRDRFKPHAEKAGVKLTFLPFIIKATVAALKKHARLNSVVDESAMEYVMRKTYDLGIAASTDSGLIVPVLRHADRLSIVETAREIERLGRLAKDGKLGREDLGGSTFTISSLGKLGGLLAPPIINYPEVGIMGVHAIRQRPVVRNGEIVIGEVMHLSFSFDHRIIDGDVGALFAQEIISFLQEPDRLLVEMS
ncbi:MAG TPA: dihydrolipoamide acetyltransferase family protein, partial [Polyangiaceae bacterium]|nr:dihydrolipoamide acetyltransferase family protein [Polyangiaceae bacterium]